MNSKRVLSIVLALSLVLSLQVGSSLYAIADSADDVLLEQEMAQRGDMVEPDEASLAALADEADDVAVPIVEDTVIEDADAVDTGDAPAAEEETIEELSVVEEESEAAAPAGQEQVSEPEPSDAVASNADSAAGQEFASEPVEPASLRDSAAGPAGAEAEDAADAAADAGADADVRQEPGAAAEMSSAAGMASVAKKGMAAQAEDESGTADAEEEDQAALNEVYLNPASGKDDAKGTADDPVKTLEQAVALLEANEGADTIYLASTLYASGEISLPVGAVLKRAPGASGSMIKVNRGESLNVARAIIDGGSASTYGALVDVYGTLVLGEEVVLRNNLSGGSGGAVEIESGASAVVNGAQILGNKAAYGGGIYVRGTLEFNSGLVDGNTSTNDGGGIYISGSSNAVTINGGTISNNKATEYGGGISVGGSRDYYGKPKLYIGYAHIDGNTCGFAGGGIFVQCSGYAQIASADITNNKAGGSRPYHQYGWYNGGGIYVNGGYESYNGVPDGVLQLGRVYISGNNASEDGGGIAACPTSKLSVYLSNGAAVGGNTWGSGANADDVFIAAGSAGGNGVIDHKGNPYYFLSSLMLGGGKNAWSRYGSTAPYELLDDRYETSSSICLVNHASAEDLARARDLAAVRIEGNKAVHGKGGGIGTNGIVDIGDEYPELGSLTVSKLVVGDEAAQAKQFSFRVTLDYKISGTYGDMEFADGVAEFTLAHNESKTATGLIPEINYTVEELDVEGFAVSYTHGQTGTIAGQERTVEAVNTQLCDISGQKRWVGDKESWRPERIVVRLFADGEELAFAEVGAEDGWAYSFTGLPVYADGQLIEYRVAEDPVTFYTTEIDGFDIVNTRTPLEVVVSKVEAGGGQELAGAELTISGTDEDGNEIEPISWTSTGTEHKLVLAPGTYTLTENQAPLGFEIAESITFVLDAEGKVTIDGQDVDGKVVMEDARTPEPEPKDGESDTKQDEPKPEPKKEEPSVSTEKEPAPSTPVEETEISTPTSTVDTPATETEQKPVPAVQEEEVDLPKVPEKPVTPVATPTATPKASPAATPVAPAATPKGGVKTSDAFGFAGMAVLLGAALVGALGMAFSRRSRKDQ